jgi:hypothetical protein
MSMPGHGRVPGPKGGQIQDLSRELDQASWADLPEGSKLSDAVRTPFQHEGVRIRRSGAGDGLRTRYLNLGKVALYRLSYSRLGTMASSYRKSTQRSGRKGKQGFQMLVSGAATTYRCVRWDGENWPLSRLRTVETVRPARTATAWTAYVSKAYWTWCSVHSVTPSAPSKLRSVSDLPRSESVMPSEGESTHILVIRCVFPILTQEFGDE